MEKEEEIFPAPVDNSIPAVYNEAQQTLLNLLCAMSDKMVAKTQELYLKQWIKQVQMQIIFCV